MLFLDCCEHRYLKFWSHCWYRFEYRVNVYKNNDPQSKMIVKIVTASDNSHAFFTSHIDEKTVTVTFEVVELFSRRGRTPLRRFSDCKYSFRAILMHLEHFPLVT